MIFDAPNHRQMDIFASKSVTTPPIFFIAFSSGNFCKKYEEFPFQNTNFWKKNKTGHIKLPFLKEAYFQNQRGAFQTQAYDCLISLMR